MPYASISGLASGLDTATIINQLMHLEAIPRDRLETRMAGEESAVSHLQDLNKLVAALATEAEKLADVEAWSPLAATSSNEDVTVSSTTGASAGSYTVTVNKLAQAHRLTTTNSFALGDVVTNGGSTDVQLTIGGKTTTLDTGDGTVRGLIDALNGPGTGVHASKIQVSDGQYALRIEAKTSGAASSFTLKQSDGATDVFAQPNVQVAQDAQIVVGGHPITSASNTFAGVIEGVEFTLARTLSQGDTFDIAVSQDTEGLTESVKKLVDKVNETLSKIDELTAYDSASNSAGPLSGDATLRSLRSSLLNTVYGVDDTSLSTVGIELDRYGKLTFDEEVFGDAYAADPVAVRAKFASDTLDGYAARVQQVAEMASDSYGGTLTNAIKGREISIERLEDSISDWDYRLELRRQTLTRQFTALETAMSQMQSQGQWLAGQIANLPSAPAL